MSVKNMLSWLLKNPEIRHLCCVYIVAATAVAVCIMSVVKHLNKTSDPAVRIKDNSCNVLLNVQHKFQLQPQNQCKTLQSIKGQIHWTVTVTVIFTYNFMYRYIFLLYFLSVSFLLSLPCLECLIKLWKPFQRGQVPAFFSKTLMATLIYVITACHHEIFFAICHGWRNLSLIIRDWSLA